MLSEEEIEKLEELSRYCALKNIDREDDIFGEFVVVIQKVENYIEQLEIKEQKLINYLESKNINTIEKEGQEPCEIYKSKKATIEIDEILKIVKG